MLSVNIGAVSITQIFCKEYEKMTYLLRTFFDTCELDSKVKTTIAVETKEFGENFGTSRKYWRNEMFDNT